MPPILNAAGSGEGRKFAIRNADFLFTPAIDLARSKDEIAALKEQAEAGGSEVDVLTFAHVVCRPTEKEATDYLGHFARTNADGVRSTIWCGCNSPMRSRFRMTCWRSSATSWRRAMAASRSPARRSRSRRASSPYVAGFRGTLSFVDYVKEFPYFRDNVLPILEEHGIRLPVRPAQAVA